MGLEWYVRTRNGFERRPYADRRSARAMRKALLDRIPERPARQSMGDVLRVLASHEDVIDAAVHSIPVMMKVNAVVLVRPGADFIAVRTYLLQRIADGVAAVGSEWELRVRRTIS